MSRTAAVLAAKDLLPNMFQGKQNLTTDESSDDGSKQQQEQQSDDASDADDVSPQQQREDVVDDLEYDLFNLLACNYHPLRIPSNDTEGGAVNVEELITTGAERATRLLIKRLMELPTEASDVGNLTLLPDEVSRFPRSTKIPEKKPETRWEKFAREKGIKKKKRERMIFDEAAQEYRPRYGYKRANGGIEDVPIVEVKPGKDPFADPWSEAKSEKKARVKKNLKNQLKNIGRATKKTMQVNSYDPSSVPGIPPNLSAAAGVKRGKKGLRAALQLTQHSTQSMGRYDERRKGEPEMKLTGRKRSFRDNLGSSRADKESMKAQLRFVADKADKKARGVTNSLAAYEGILPDAPAGRFKQKKGKGKDSSSEGKKKRKK